MALTESPSGSANDRLHELDAPPWSRVESTIVCAAADIRRLYDERFSPIDLTLSLASLLCYVADFGPVSQTRAADHLRQGRAVTGTQIDRLEQRGLIERLPDPNDRRVWLVQLTSEGTALASSAIEIDVVLRKELRSGIPREDRQALANVLVRLQHNISAALEDELGENP
jgi:MarR family transcriptional regulator for hemolysin